MRGCRVIRAKFIIIQNIASRNPSLSFKLAKMDRVRLRFRHVIHNLHTNDPTAGIAITVRGGNDHLVGNGIVTGLTLFMFIRGLLQMKGIVQPTCGGIIAVDYKRAFICAHWCIGKFTVLIDRCAVNGNGGHAVGRGHCHAARGC